MNEDDSQTCVFCDIVRGQIPAARVYEGDDIIAFRDVAPAAPTHILIVPREHIASAAYLTPAQDTLWGRMLRIAQALSEDEGVDDDGYRLVVNVGPAGGQTVPHLHLHLLGGRSMAWPPG